VGPWQRLTGEIAAGGEEGFLDPGVGDRGVRVDRSAMVEVAPAPERDRLVARGEL